MKIKKENKTRERDYTTILIDKDTHWKIKSIAFSKRIPMTELLREVFNNGKEAAQCQS